MSQETEKSSTVSMKKKPQLPKSAYRFFLQNCQEQRRTLPKIKMIDFSKECAEVWKDLTAEPKHTFQLMAEKDKQRYLQEMKVKMSLEKGSTVDMRKPKLPKKAYRFFLQNCQKERRRILPKIRMIDFTKDCAKVWKGLTPEKRQPFQMLADKDKQRYRQEMKEGNFAIPTRRQRKTRGRKLKDPNAPKKFLTPYFWFCKEEREKVKKKFPDFRPPEIATELGRMWAEVPPESKQRFQEMSTNDKARYHKEVEEYTKRLLEAAGWDSAVSESEEDEEGNIMENVESQ